MVSTCDVMLCCAYCTMFYSFTDDIADCVHLLYRVGIVHLDRNSVLVFINTFVDVKLIFNWKILA